MRLRTERLDTAQPEIWREDEAEPCQMPVARMIQTSYHPLASSKQTTEEARRLVACWNYCENIPTDLLEDYAAGAGMVNEIIRKPLKQKMQSLSSEVLEIIENSELLEVGRKAVEDELVQYRDARVSQMRGNGLAIMEADGTASPVIRMGVEQAITIALKAIAERLNDA